MKKVWKGFAAAVSAAAIAVTGFIGATSANAAEPASGHITLNNNLKRHVHGLCAIPHQFDVIGNYRGRRIRADYVHI